MAGEFRDLVAKGLEALHRWWPRRSQQPAPLRPVESTRELEEILFKPLDPSLANVEAVEVSPTTELTAMCPVTRQTVDLRRGCYVCRACGIAYSREGWEFLVQKDKGRCCVCSGQGCVSFRAHIERSQDRP